MSVVEELDLSREELMLIVRSLNTHEKAMRGILDRERDFPEVLTRVGFEIDEAFAVRNTIFKIADRMTDEEFLRGTVIFEGDDAPKVDPRGNGPDRYPPILRDADGKAIDVG